MTSPAEWIGGVPRLGVVATECPALLKKAIAPSPEAVWNVPPPPAARVDLLQLRAFAQPEVAAFAEVDAGPIAGDRPRLRGELGPGGGVDQAQAPRRPPIEVGGGRVAAFAQRNLAGVGGQRRAAGEHHLAEVRRGAGKAQVELGGLDRGVGDVSGPEQCFKAPALAQVVVLVPGRGVGAL